MPKTLKLNDLLESNGIAPADTIIMRHKHPDLHDEWLLPQCAFYFHNEFNAYQSCHNEDAESSLEGISYLASFVAVPEKGNVFVGLYKNAGAEVISETQFASKPEHRRLFRNGYKFRPWREGTLWFDLHRMDVMKEHSRRLKLEWSARNYVGRPLGNDFTVQSLDHPVFIKGQISRD